MNPQKVCPNCGVSLLPDGNCPNCLADETLATPPTTQADDATIEAGVTKELTTPAGESSTQKPSGSGLMFSSAVERAGDVIGHYTLVEVLGEGGMGAVWKASQTEPVKREVAFKLIKLGMDTKEVVARFEAERQALAMMDHPHIAKVLDAGATETGRPFFVMEMVTGTPITDFCDEHNLSTAKRLELFTKTCSAIQHAHQKGIIHRDIKPSNVLVSFVDGEPSPKVIDFGIAKATDQSLTDSTVVTQAHAFIGTPAYMSPEQAGGGARGIDTRADIYALGVLLYELLTGRLPFDPKKLREAGLAEMRRIICEVEPPKPSTRLNALPAGDRTTIADHRETRLETLSTQLKGDLDWIVMKSLEKEPARRYESANSFADDIQRHLHNEPVVARPPTGFYVLQKLIRRNRIAFAAGFVVLLSLVSGVTVSTNLYFKELTTSANEKIARVESEVAQAEAEHARQEAEAQRLVANDARDDAEAAKVKALTAQAEATHKAEIATAVNNFLRFDLLRQAGSVAQANSGFRSNPNLTIKEALNRSAERVGDRFENQPAIESEIRRTIGQAFVDIGDAASALVQFQEAHRLSASNAGERHTNTFFAKRGLALANLNAGNISKSISMYQEVAELAKDLFAPDHSQHTSIKLNLANAYISAGQFRESASLCEEVVEARTKSLGENHALTLVALDVLAQAYSKLDDYAKATPLMERVWETRQTTLGEDHPLFITSMRNLALLYEQSGRLDDAFKLLTNTVPKLEGSLGMDHPVVLGARSSVAVAHITRGRPAKAIEILEDVVRRGETSIGDAHPSVLVWKGNLAIALGKADRHAEAISLKSEVLAQSEETLGQKHPHSLRRINELAMALMAAGTNDIALSHLERSLKLHVEVMGGGHARTMDTRELLNRAKDAQRPESNSLARLRQEFSQLSNSLKPNDPKLLMASFRLGAALVNAWRSEEAAEQLKFSYQLHKNALGEFHPRTLNVQFWLASAYNHADQNDLAETTFRSVIEAFKNHDSLGQYGRAAKIRLGTVLIESGKLEEAEAILRDVLAEFAATNLKNEPHIDAHLQLGKALVARGNAREAEAVFRAAKKMLDDAGDKISVSFRRAGIQTLSKHLGAKSKTTPGKAKSLDDLKEVYEKRRQKLGSNQTDTLIAALGYAKALEKAGQLEQAAKVYAENLKGFEHQFGLDHINSILFRSSLSQVYAKLGRHADAEPLLRAQVTTVRKKHEPGKMFYPMHVAALAKNQLNQAKFEQAEKLYREVQSMVDDDPKMAYLQAEALFGRGAIHLARDQEAKALETLLKGVERLTQGDKHFTSLRKTQLLVFGLPYLVKTYETRGDKLNADRYRTKLTLAKLITSDHEFVDGASAETSTETIVPNVADLEKAVADLRDKTDPGDTGFLLELSKLAEAYRLAGNQEKCMEISRELVRIHEEKSGDDHPRTLSAMSDLGLAHLAAGQYTEAERLLTKTVTLQTARLGTNHLATLLSLERLGQAFHDSEQARKAVGQFRQALEISQTLRGPKHADTLKVSGSLAQALESVGELTNAIALFEQTLVRQMELLGVGHRDTLTSMNDLGSAYMRDGRSMEAKKLLAKTVELKKTHLGTNSPSTLTSLEHLGRSHAAAEEYEESVPAYTEAIAISQAMFGTNSSRALNNMTRLANVLSQSEKWNEAIEVFRQIVGIRRGIDAKHPDTLLAMRGLGVLYNRTGKATEAIRLMEESVALHVMVLGETNVKTMDQMYGLAINYHKAGQLKDGINVSQRALALMRKTFGHQHGKTLAQMLSLAKMQQAAEQPAAAAPLFQEYLGAREASQGKGFPGHRYVTAELARIRLRMKNYSEAEELFRKVGEGTTDREINYQYISMAGRGAVALGQNRLKTAEALLTSAYSSLQRARISPTGRQLWETFCAKHLIQVYEAKNDEANVTKWQAKLSALNPKEQKK